MNRPRNKGSKDLPPNLYASKQGAKIYYTYRHPKAFTRHGMGSDRTQAILAAQQLNSLLVVPESAVDRVIGRTALFSDWLNRYSKVREDEKKLKPRSLKLLQYDIELMRDQLGALPISDISVFHCAEFLDTWVREGKRRMASRMRSQLILCLDYAAAHGMIESNPAKKTLPIQAKVLRKRLTLDQFKAIHAIAPLHIQNAMMLALLTLQRREDVATMRFRDIRDGVLYVKQSKTSAAKKGKRADSVNSAAHLAIKITPTLSEVITSCRRTGVVSQYLIHHIHGRKSAGATHTKVLPGNRLQPDNITRGFATARNRTGLFDHLPANERPTFHEIRSLGAHLYGEQGIDPQGLLGHTDAKMTQHYLDGHGLKWTLVAADLAI